ncbi:hypothetical protein DES53_101474 [Roseimicrobium gellanilyticum]|uniref:Uncharacterized protein n=1 Tax=Roseimicrobium gellanilyticum TaxID=748857 RepID=A0A366HTR4_9BACT|nr:hypothetical protein [Roseimicrobium gellanilyticum]RBP47676.1 hypothetical protein DES53_101474 [Roseimicrobium gellanilyticum]
MKGCLPSLVALVVVAAILATGLVPGYIASSIFGVENKGVMAITAGGIALALYGIYRWLIYLQDREKRVLSVLTDPVFGEVKQLRDHWEADQPISEGGEAVEIWGDALAPTSAQTSTFTNIRERWPALLALCVEAANNLIASVYHNEKGPVPSVKAEQLNLKTVALDDGNIGDFTLMFELPSAVKLLPWGLDVTFENFVVVEASDNH